jgi:hypothetical protein
MDDGVESYRGGSPGLDIRICRLGCPCREILQRGRSSRRVDTTCIYSFPSPYPYPYPMSGRKFVDVTVAVQEAIEAHHPDRQNISTTRTDASIELHP